jgi:phenylalanyl-tRNA synthetase beta chain
VGFAWEADEVVRSAWDLTRPVYLAQIRLDALPFDPDRPVAYREPSRYPAVRRDLALIVPENRNQEEVRQLVIQGGGANLVSVELFDHYRGKHIPPGCVGLGFSLMFRSRERTLEEKEVDAAVDHVVEELGREGIHRREA